MDFITLGDQKHSFSDNIISENVLCLRGSTWSLLHGSGTNGSLKYQQQARSYRSIKKGNQDVTTFRCLEFEWLSRVRGPTLDLLLEFDFRSIAALSAEQSAKNLWQAERDFSPGFGLTKKKRRYMKVVRGRPR